MISPSQRPLPDNTQHSQQTNIHAPGGIRTHDRSRRAAVDLRLRPRGHWDRHFRGLSDIVLLSALDIRTLRWDQYSFSKRRVLFILWSGTIGLSQKKGDLNCTAAKISRVGLIFTSRLIQFYFLRTKICTSLHASSRKPWTTVKFTGSCRTVGLPYDTSW